jgi:hypothetical protein
MFERAVNHSATNYQRGLKRYVVETLRTRIGTLQRKCPMCPKALYGL